MLPFLHKTSPANTNYIEHLPTFKKCKEVVAKIFWLQDF